MITTVNSKRKNPCEGCPDRYQACSDHCRKPEYLQWKEEQKQIRDARKQYRQNIWCREEPYVKRNPLRRKKK